MYRTKGFVLSRRERGEADYEVTLFTESFGLIRGVAQGIRKPGAKLMGHLEPMTGSEIQFVSGKNSYRIIGATLEDSLLDLHQSLLGMRAAHRAGALIEAVSFEGKDLALWGALEEFFLYLNSKRTQEEIRKALFWFYARALFSFGYQISEEASDGKTRSIIQGLERTALKEVSPEAEDAIIEPIMKDAILRHLGEAAFRRVFQV